jgi:hypothetical protein
MPAKKTTKATTKAAKKKQPKKGKPTAPKKPSALDAAAQVLSENGGSMTTKKLWESPNGKTPAATLYAAILRELTTKGKDSRFQKTEPGKFAATGAAKKTKAATRAKTTGKKATEPAERPTADPAAGGDTAA